MNNYLWCLFLLSFVSIGTVRAYFATMSQRLDDGDEMISDMCTGFNRISTLGSFAAYIFLILIKSLEYFFLNIIFISAETVAIFLRLRLALLNYFDR